MSLSVTLFRKMKMSRCLGGLKNFKYARTQLKEMKLEFEKFEPQKDQISISEENKKIFYKAFKKFIWQQNHEAEIWKGFLFSDIVPVKVNSHSESGKNEPIVICVVKDDLTRMENFIAHYHKLGVRKFAIVDNDSTDGTKEWLLNNDDVDLFECKTPYTTLNREAWINRIIASYGFNRWYLVADSDELFVYTNCENENIHAYIEKLTANGMRRTRSVLLDMYSEGNLFEENKIDGDIQSVYKYFDKDGYTERKVKKYEEITGGPRARVCAKFGNEKAKFLLTKHPLFYFMPGDVEGSSHFSFPYDCNFDLPCTSALLHYKFLSTDMNKYRDRAKKGSFASGSAEYRAYVKLMDSKEKYTFFDENKSIKYKNSECLNELSFFEQLK